MNWKILAAAAVIAALPAHAEPTRFQPSSKWNVDFGASQCVAQRAYSDGVSTLTFAMKPSPLGEVVLLVLASNGKAGLPRQRPLKIRLDEGAWITTTMLVHGVTPENASGTILRRVNFPSSMLQQIAKARTIEFASDGLEATLPLESLPKVAAALEQCRETLRQDWSVAQYYFAKVQTGPKPVTPLRHVFTDKDYPAAALYRNQGGQTGLVVLVDEQGVVQDCTMFQESGIAALDTQACAIITKRAKFTPAVGKDGKPIKAPFTAHLIWRIP